MSITINPTIDRTNLPFITLFYLDQGAAIFGCVGNPNNVIIANKRSIAIDEAGNIYTKSTDNSSSGWAAIGGGGGSVNPGIIKRVAFYAATGAVVDDAAGFEYQQAASPNVLVEAQASLSPFQLKQAASIGVPEAGGSPGLLTTTAVNDSVYWHQIIANDAAPKKWVTFLSNGSVYVLAPEDFATEIDFLPNGGISVASFASKLLASFFGISATYFGQIFESSSDHFALGFNTVDSAAGTPALVWTDHGIGINKSTAILAQLHAESGLNTRAVARFDSAASPTAVTVLITNNGITNIPANGIKQYHLLLTSNSLRTSLRIDGFNNAGNDAPEVELTKSRGTNAAPAAIADLDTLGKIEFRGQFNTGINNNAEGASIFAVADGQWTGSNNGAEIFFVTTSNGTTSPTYRGKWSDKGTFCIDVNPSGDSTVNNLLVGNVGHETDAVVSLVAVNDADTTLEVQGNVSMDATAYIARFRRRGDGSPRARINPNGIVETRAGTGVDFARADGVLKTNITTVGNVGVGEDTLHDIQIVASTLAADGDFLKVFCTGATAANANTKQLRFKFGGVTFFDTGALAANAKNWIIESTIIRLGATSVRIFGSFSYESISGASFFTNTFNTTLTPTLANNQQFAVTGEAIADNDVTQNVTIIRRGDAAI